MADYRVIVQSSNTRSQRLPSGGPYDIYVQGVFQPSFEGLLTFRLGEVSSKLSGIIKLSQQYLITLFTTIGSDMYEPNKGTELASLIGGNFFDEDEVRVIISDSVRSAAKQVIRQQSFYRPQNPDELLVSAELKSLSVVEDAATPYILIRSAAGALTNVSLPNINVY